MRLYPEITFELRSADAMPRLKNLLAWLSWELAKARADLDKMPDEKPRTDTLGRQLMTETSRKRDALETRVARLAEDIAMARVWLIECGTEQSWRIGLELAHWLNRPALAESSEG